MTTCTATPENIGKGRCNHIAHQRPNEDIMAFTQRSSNINGVDILRANKIYNQISESGNLGWLCVYPDKIGEAKELLSSCFGEDVEFETMESDFSPTLIIQEIKLKDRTIELDMGSEEIMNIMTKNDIKPDMIAGEDNEGTLLGIIMQDPYNYYDDDNMDLKEGWIEDEELGFVYKVDNSPFVLELVG